MNNQRNVDASMMLKVELLADDAESTDDPFFHEDQSSTLFESSLAEGSFPFRESLASLMLETTASIDAISDESPGLHDSVSVNSSTRFIAFSDGFSEYDEFLRGKFELQEISDGSSVDLYGMMGFSMQDDLADVDGFESFKQFYDVLGVNDDFVSTSLSSELVEESNSLFSLGIGSVDGSAHSHDLVVSHDCADEALGNEINSVEEEAKLLEEENKTDEINLVTKDHDNSEKHGLMMGSPQRCCSDATTASKYNSDTEQRGKGDNVTSARKKTKVDWTPELHRRFVQAVEQLGVEKAIPSRILEIMGVQCLTRHNIASHLQKYRSHRKHLLVREAEAAKWNHRRHVESTSCWHTPQFHVATSPNNVQPKAISPMPMQSYRHPLAPPLHVWGHPSVDMHSQLYMCHKPPLAAPPWLASNGANWQQQPCIDAWGHGVAPGMPYYPQGVMRLPLAPMPGVAKYMDWLEDTVKAEKLDTSDSTIATGNRGTATSRLPKESVDAAINEVLINPCVPLPLGLKAPSLESVISELQRQGFRTTTPWQSL